MIRSAFLGGRGVSGWTMDEICGVCSLVRWHWMRWQWRTHEYVCVDIYVVPAALPSQLYIHSYPSQYDRWVVEFKWRRTSVGFVMRGTWRRNDSRTKHWNRIIRRAGPKDMCMGRPKNNRVAQHVAGKEENVKERERKSKQKYK